jgi:hypothetical protein
MTKKDLLEAIEDMPKTIFGDRCFFMRRNMDNVWYCGYDNTSVFASDKDILTALDKLYIILKTHALC